MKKALALPVILLSGYPVTGFAQTLNADALVNGLQLGVSGGYYRYSENPDFMELESASALNLHAAYQSDYMLPLLGQKTLRFEGRAGRTSDNYSSASGFSDNNESTIFEARALFVGRFNVAGITLNPYWGYGYRFLYNDLNDTNTGALGYERISQYHYLPLGTWASYPLGQNGSVVGQLEYAPLLRGYQYSNINSGLHNKQTSGHHIAAFAGYRHGSFTVGPYLDFWRVGDSDVDCAGNFCGLEPKNFTREAGLKATYQFSTH